MRLRLAALVVAVLVIVTTLTAVQFPLLVGWLRHYVRQDWVLGLLIAVIICCLAVYQFWAFHRSGRFWVVLAAYLVLHFLVAVPVLGSFGPVKFGFGELCLWLTVFLEWAVVFFVLRRVTARLAKTGN